jgi:hypothetical protein
MPQAGLTEALIGKRDKTVTMGGDNLSDVHEVEGTWEAKGRSFCFPFRFLIQWLKTTDVVING